MAAGCLASRAASWRNENLTFTYLLQRFLGALKTPEVYVKRPFSCSQGLRGLERSQHLLLPLRVEARKAWGCWRQDHWATAKAWEALTTESRCRGPRGTRRRALNCSSRGGISPPTGVRRQPSGDPRVCQRTGPRRWRHDHTARDPQGARGRGQVAQTQEAPEKSPQNSPTERKKQWQSATTHMRTGPSSIPHTAKNTAEGADGTLVLERKGRKTYYSMSAGVEVKNLVSGIKFLNRIIIACILR